jgi:hypothetical protein
MTQVAEWVAGIPFRAKETASSGLSKVGGRLVLSTEDLVFRPLWGLGMSHRFLLSQVASIAGSGERPPRIQIVLQNGAVFNFIVAPNRHTLSRSIDASARDDALSRIGALIGTK